MLNTHIYIWYVFFSGFANKIYKKSKFWECKITEQIIKDFNKELYRQNYFYFLLDTKTASC